jgi:hypothetical protein
MPFPFIVSENDLTAALFHNASLHSTGTGTKSDARAMLAADVLLTTCQSVLDSLERNLTEDCLPETRAIGRIRVALGV